MVAWMKTISMEVQTGSVLDRTNLFLFYGAVEVVFE
jgi:hypothetical protein